jgi:methanogenic corrinoid protein MtbC1
LARLDLDRHQVAERLVRRAGLPDTPEGREVVDLHLCALDVSLEIGDPALLAPQLHWEASRWPQVAAGPGAGRVWAALRHVLADHLDELTLLTVVRHVEAADAEAAASALRAAGRGGRDGLAGLSPDAQVYLGHALAGRDRDAVSHVLALADAGWSVPEVMLGVLAPAPVEVGRLWERGAITVAHEHVATAVAHLVLYSLYPRLSLGVRLGRTAVAATVPGDRHSFGLRLVSDLLQHRGWDVQYVGTACPVPDLVEAAVEAGATLVLLGASMTCHLPVLRTAVRQVRSDPRTAGTAILVGGAPFRQVTELAEWSGADLAAGDAVEAVSAAMALVDLEAPSRP